MTMMLHKERMPSPRKTPSFWGSKRDKGVAAAAQNGLTRLVIRCPVSTGVPAIAA